MVGRPALIGHVGEWIAREIFGISLEDSAVQKGFGGWFADGPLGGKTVNVKWYGKGEGLLDINPDSVPDFYLAMTGPKSFAASSRGGTRPSTTTEVFLFDGLALVERLTGNGVKLGSATSVRQNQWEAARIYPEVDAGAPLALSDEQREKLKLFGITG